MTDLFLHNPRCSKSRAALALVREAGVELPVREYLRDPLSVDELRRIVRLLGVRPIEIVRRGEAVFAELGLGDGTADIVRFTDLRIVAAWSTVTRLICGPQRRHS